MKRKVYRDGNGSGLISVEGLGEYLPARGFKIQQAEIAELKLMLAVADARINKQVDENNELILTITRMKHTLEVIASNPDWNDHHCRAMKLLEEYSEHNKLREQK